MDFFFFTVEPKVFHDNNPGSWYWFQYVFDLPPASVDHKAFSQIKNVVYQDEAEKSPEFLWKSLKFKVNSSHVNTVLQSHVWPEW